VGTPHPTVPAIYEDKKVTVEEAALMRTIQDKVWKGEIEIYD
jgi:hypothetical protein